MAQKLALLIGPSYAPGLPSSCGPLPGVQNDLWAMKQMLCSEYYGFQLKNIEVLDGDMASRNNILRSLGKLSSMAPRESVVIIYFSGHGFELDTEFDQGLLPGCLTREMVDEYHIYDVCITGEHFKPHLLKLIDKKCLVNTIFDCCYSGRLYRGFREKDGPSLVAKKLDLPKEYIDKYCEILKSKGPRIPVEHVDPFSGTGTTSTAVLETQWGQGVGEPMEHQPSQETQPPSPMEQHTLLQYPQQEFWTPILKAQGWTPSYHDKFIHIAASASNELAYEDPSRRCGCLTSALVEVLDEAHKERKKISYNILKSLIKQKFAEKMYISQTPQFEGGDMDMVVFDGFDKVTQPKSFEVCEVEDVEGFKKVVLNAGKLHGVVDGEYDVCRPDVIDDDARPENLRIYWVTRIDVGHSDIGMLKTRGTELYKRDGKGPYVGCKAILTRRRSMCTAVNVKLPDFQLDQQFIERMNVAIENQGMFALETEEKPHCITLDIKEVEGKNCWRACQYGRMIAPYQETGDEYQMMKNLAKYFRLKFAIKPKQSNQHMLKNVTFQLFKVENVPSFKVKDLRDRKAELIAEATKTADLSISSEFRPHDVPTFLAHTVELTTTMYDRKKPKVIDGSGDALVLQVTNNEDRPIHVCVVSHQADGSIVILHPPKNGHTEVLRPGESTQTIKRVLLEPDTVRRMVEPDFDKPKPEGCNDVLILYATTEQTDYEPLTQTAIELSPNLSTRGPNRPDGLRLASTNEFREAMRPPRPKIQSARDTHPKWLTIKREIRVLYNPNQKPL